MFKVYFKGSDVPNYIMTVTGARVPSVKFGGIVVVYKHKGVIYLKPLTGNSIVHMSDRVNCSVIFNDVILRPKTNPLNVLRRVRYLLTRIIMR